MWHRYTGKQPHHRFDGRLLILGLILTLLLGSVCTAQAEEALQGIYNPDVPPPLAPEHEPTGDEYFTDAVFVGDSMMEYIELLGEIPTANYVWKIGMGPGTVGQKQFRVRGQEEYLSAYDMIVQYNPKKIFILLGGNGLDWYGSDVVIADYEVMVDQLITLCPEAMIYVISCSPGSAEAMAGRGTPPGRFVQFAEKLQALAERKGLYYLDFYSLVADENGALPQEYDSGDGYHLSTPAYQKLIQLVRTHTVPYPDEQ